MTFAIDDDTRQQIIRTVQQVVLALRQVPQQEQVLVQEPLQQALVQGQAPVQLQL
jgi:hypothetical protein